MSDPPRSRHAQPRTPAWAVWTAAWLAFQGGLLWLLGVRMGGDSGRYLAGADSLLRGEWPPGGAVYYVGYDLLVAPFTWSGLGPAGVVGAQVGLAGLAACCLYRLATRLYGPPAGMLAAALYAFYPDLQAWNFYVLTDSPFVSLAVVAGYLFTQARTPRSRAAAGVLVLLASVVRPHGVAVLIAAAISVLYSLGRTRRYALLGALAAALVLGAPVGLAVVGGMARDIRLVEHYAGGTVIWGYDGLRLPMPGPLPEQVTSETNPIRQLVAFATERPGAFLRLVAWKLGYEFLHARPYYSALHNAFLLATLLPAYALALWGLGRPAADPAARAFLVALAVAQSLVIGLTFADWDGRHLLVILPVVFVFAAAGARDLADRGGLAGRGLGTRSPPREADRPVGRGGLAGGDGHGRLRAGTQGTAASGCG